MTARMIADARRYTKREKQAYHDRERRRRGQREILINGRRVWVDRFQLQRGTFNFADGLGSRIPTPRVNWDFL